MRAPLRLASLILLLASAGPAVCAESDFSQAAQRYAAADFPGAAAIYRSMLESQPRNASLRFNLGNALFKAGRTGPAIAEYQRAYDIRPRDADIRYNLDFALKRAGEELVPAGVPPFLHYLFHLLGTRELAGLHWIACWAALLLASLALLRRSVSGPLGWWGAAAAAAWIFFGGWWGTRKALEPTERAVVTKPFAEIRSGPGDNFSVAFTAPEGRRVEILSENGRWLEIGLAKEGAKGWILSESVERL
ncbi:MAG: tetratricopeptide repeat protein [Elusimicrobia bacterium]|nr:tetratricopeptide repeat protein [Elusimicrobiota bacterium]